MVRKAIAAFLLLTTGASNEGQVPLKTSGTFTIEAKATAAEQFAYATRISPDAADLSERNRAVLQAVAALELIPQRWPDDRPWGVRAYREMVSRLAGAELHGNAAAVCDEAIAYAGKWPESLLFFAAKARSLMWLGRVDAARAAMDRATSGDFNRLDDFSKNSILLDAVFFYERDHDYRTAAKHARARARIARNALGSAEAWRKALELSMQAHDDAAAKADLAALYDAALSARMHALTAEESAVLRRIDAEIAEHRKKLGM